MQQCPVCSKEVQSDAYFCAWCSTFLADPRRGKKANLFARWFAWFLDPFIAIALYIVATFVAGIIFAPFSDDAAAAAIAFVGLVFPLAYIVWFLMLLRKGLTPGKKLLGLQVVRFNNGEIPGFGLMFLREVVGRFLSGFFFGIGYIWALIDKNAQAWHDKLAGTVVLSGVKVPQEVAVSTTPVSPA